MLPRNQLDIENLIRGLMGAETGMPSGTPTMGDIYRPPNPLDSINGMETERPGGTPIMGGPTGMAPAAAPHIRGGRYEINN